MVSENLGASVEKKAYHFRDRTTQALRWVDYMFIKIGPVIPDCVRDVILFHELREMYYMSTTSLESTARHIKALGDEKKYMKKFLPRKDRRIMEKFRCEFKPRPVKL